MEFGFTTNCFATLPDRLRAGSDNWRAKNKEKGTELR
jgi:hypothetical protein